EGEPTAVRRLGRVRRRHETGGDLRLQPAGGRRGEGGGPAGQEERGVLPADRERAHAGAARRGRPGLNPAAAGAGSFGGLSPLGGWRLPTSPRTQRRLFYTIPGAYLIPGNLSGGRRVYGPL